MSPATKKASSAKPQSVSNSKSSVKGKGKAKALPEPAPQQISDEAQSSEEQDDDEEEGVDEEGMKRLMEALGEDGLGDFELAQLGALGGEESEENEDEAGEDEDGVSGEEGEEMEGEDEEDEAEGPSLQNDLDEDEEQEAIPLDEVESIDEDAVPRQKIEIDNKIALELIRDTIKLDESLPWTETLAVTYPHKIDVDVDDDLNRELAFYKQALTSAQTARSLAHSHSLAFTRPPDYFAEMVKSDAHMERIRSRLLDERAQIKRAEDKRKEREGKKFGKQVQLEKQKERERGKKEMEERLKGLKRKRKDALDKPEEDDGAFDVAVEDAISDRPSKRSRPDSSKGGKSKLPRQARDRKFGFGGAGRRSKQNDKSSTDNFDFGGGKGNKGKGGAKGGKGKGGKSPRPGKSKRMAGKGRS